MGFNNPLVKAPQEASITPGSQIGVDNVPGSTVATSSSQFMALQGQTVPAGEQYYFALDSFDYPDGTDSSNYHSALVAVQGTAGHLSGVISVQDGNGLYGPTVPIAPIPGFPAFAYAVVPVLFGDASSGDACVTVLNDDTIDPISVDVILAQEALPAYPSSVPAAVGGGGNNNVSYPLGNVPGAQQMAASSGKLLKAGTLAVDVSTVTTPGRVIVSDTGTGSLLADVPIATTGFKAVPLAIPDGGYLLLGEIQINQDIGNLAGKAAVVATW